jgi:hypothetical protein
MQWGDSKVFEALISGMNGYVVVVLQHFALYDSHMQLCPIMQVLRDYGICPDLVFSGMPKCDQVPFEQVCPSLTVDVKPLETQIGKILPLMPLCN